MLLLFLGDRSLQYGFPHWINWLTSAAAALPPPPCLDFILAFLIAASGNRCKVLSVFSFTFLVDWCVPVFIASYSCLLPRAVACFEIIWLSCCWTLCVMDVNPSMRARGNYLPLLFRKATTKHSTNDLKLFTLIRSYWMFALVSLIWFWSNISLSIPIS